ncbi:hypothetical protein [Liquorilactobacillus cacaonum]|uniref:Uncharacterized protein n=1 Tax=Liquorilactobacillus cacaonum DSM 21116 TaxID=1423729 RepID=A0A0R2CLF8_9LACO|nr:hypothetical protein [Liquorilactobacillus cacaonum]KRM92048.1 hypothetical protein FC80_GL000228 [Liquorilactobacillus cacaonum DSM 21116]
MAIKTKNVVVNDWEITTNQDSNVLVGDSDVVGVTNPTDITDVIIITLKGSEVELGHTFFGAKISISTNKKIKVLFDDEE